jgi:hypothetical protein
MLAAVQVAATAGTERDAIATDADADTIRATRAGRTTTNPSTGQFQR